MNRYQFPTSEDVDGAIAALLRLQETYNLDSTTVANGSLGSSRGLSMTSKRVHCKCLLCKRNILLKIIFITHAVLVIAAGLCCLALVLLIKVIHLVLYVKAILI